MLDVDNCELIWLGKINVLIVVVYRILIVMFVICVMVIRKVVLGCCDVGMLVSVMVYFEIRNL